LPTRTCIRRSAGTPNFRNRIDAMIAKAAEPKALSIYGVHAVRQTADTSMNIKEKPPEHA